MGYGLNFSLKRAFLSLLRKAGVSLLALSLCLFPGATHAGQSGSFGQAAGTNNLAANLGKVTSVISMAAGSLYMAQGAAQLKCCTAGCSGSGAASQKTNSDITERSKKDSKAVRDSLKRSLDFLRFPDEANGCPNLRPAGPGFLLFDLLRPAKAEAGAGCLDALLALATGGLMLMQGMMGMQAANKAAQNADNANGNMGGMNSTAGTYGGTYGTSPTPDSLNSSRGSSSLAADDRTVEQVKIDPSLLRTGKANDIMNQFESKFGISRDQFANAVANGEDPRTLLGSAPDNALSNADMNKALKEAKEMSEAEKANALSGTQLAAAQKELADKMGASNTGAGESAYAVNLGAAAPRKSSFSRKKADDESLDEIEGREPASDLKLSPEVQAALAAKALDERRNGVTDLTIFQVVHLKYREKSKFIFGYDPDGVPKGVRDVDGI